jgi:hypothetical protein
METFNGHKLSQAQNGGPVDIATNEIILLGVIFDKPAWPRAAWEYVDRLIILGHTA